MTIATEYRKKAAEFAALARRELNPVLHMEHAKMAQSYLHLATLADRNSQSDLVYETPTPPPERP
jgi:hypothetical protein